MEHVKRVLRPGLAPLDYTYDQGRLSRVTLGFARPYRPPVFRTEYGESERLRAVPPCRVAGNEWNTASTWDAEGELLTLTPPGKPVHEFIYAPTLTRYKPPLVSGVDASTVAIQDQDRRPRKTVLPDGDALDYSYHPTTGKLQKITSTQGNISFTYQDVPACAAMICPCSTPGCAPGRLSTAIGPSGVKLDFGYLGPLVVQNKSARNLGAPDNLATTTIDWEYNNYLEPSAERVRATTELGTPAYDARSSIAYNNDGQLTCVEATSTGACDLAAADAQVLSYDAASGFLTGTKLGAITDSYAYTSFGELKEYEAKNTTPDPDASLYRVTYDSATNPRDFLGRVKRKTEVRNGVTKTFDYTYDAQGRLSGVTDATGTRTYTYDANGNRQLPGAVYDDQDRLLQANGSTYTYSPTGALKSKTTGSEIREFAYDNFGNLRTVVFKTGSTVTKTIDYLVDALGRRVAKKVNGAVVKQYAYRNKLQLAAELDVPTHTVRRFWYTTRANAPDFMEVKTATTATMYRIVSDQLGSPQLLVNTATGAIETDLLYDEWGRVDSAGAAKTPVGFAGGIYDVDTALLRFGARDYDPIVGRWLNRDPILFSGTQTNLYAYVGNDPVNKIDPFGLKDWSDCETRELLKNYAGWLKGSPSPYSLIGSLHGGGGDFDFWAVAKKDTFALSGVGKMDSAQFGNFIAGYAAGVMNDPLAYWLVRGAGSLFGVGGSLYDSKESPWGELQYLGDNRDSVWHIDLGAGFGLRTDGNP